MGKYMRILNIAVFWFVVLCVGYAENDTALPEFGKDTVLVWETQIQDSKTTFVVRIASFYPNRLLEWEDRISQGTVFISNQNILEANSYVNNNLFKQGMDTRSDNETTLWLSRKTFKTLKEKKKVNCKIDRVPGKLTYEGEDALSVEVNGSLANLPVIKVRDDRGSEKWFLDDGNNPVLMKYIRRYYNQTLVSITTNRPNTLRWLKGQKLERLLKQ